MRFFLSFALVLLVPSLSAQERGLPPLVSWQSSEPAEFTTCFDRQDQQQSGERQQPGKSGASSSSEQAGAKPPQTCAPAADENAPRTGQQPKRILGVMPNFRAVSAGTRPPPPTPKQSFMLATQNSFDYSSFIFVGITSLLAEGTNAHPQLGKGVSGFGRYYWRGFVDKTNGNYLVLFALPTIFHQDERYYTLGKGGFWKRAVYAASRVIITPNYQGNDSFNISELLGRAMAQGISAAYYPSQARTAGALATKWGYAVGRDALTSVVREFWPDIEMRVLHRHP